MAGCGGLCVFCIVPNVEGNSSVVRLVSSGVMGLVTFCVVLVWYKKVCGWMWWAVCVLPSANCRGKQ